MLEEKHKVCFKCGELKPLSAFYKHPRMADGHVNKCKECNKKDVHKNRNDKIDYYQEYDRLRSRDKESERSQKRKEYQKQEHVKLKKSKLLQRRREKYPERQKANNLVSNWIRDGRLIRPQNCEFCGKECKPQAHHSSYSEDMWPIVTWLCSSCHGEVHRKYD